MFTGKKRCKILKEIRRQIAENNDIEFITSECKHQGDCPGTCPKCEAEVRELEAALARREALGKKVAVVGISASLALSVTGCVDPFTLTNNGELQGAMPALTNEKTFCDIAIQGVEVQTETGDLVIHGETLSDTEEPLMGDMVFVNKV